MNKNESGTANIIPEHKWISHYKALWSNNNVKAELSNIETNNSVTYERDLITMDELEDTLGKTINQKSTGQYGFCLLYTSRCV